jgi:hypothetical protein
MAGWSHYISNWMYKPWLGDPAKRFDYAQSINPSCSLSLSRRSGAPPASWPTPTPVAVQGGVHAEHGGQRGDQRLRHPEHTTNLYLETWAQPDAKDLHGNPQEAVPPGLNLQTLRRHQVLSLNGAGSANTLQLANTGNELRGVLMVVRDSNGVRQDWLSDPIRLRLDTRAMGTFSPNELFNLMNDFYDQLQNGTSVGRPASTAGSGSATRAT